VLVGVAAVHRHLSRTGRPAAFTRAVPSWGQLYQRRHRAGRRPAATENGCYVSYPHPLEILKDNARPEAAAGVRRARYALGDPRRPNLQGLRQAKRGGADEPALTGVAALIWPAIRLAEEIDQREIVWFVHFSKPKCCARASGC